MRNTTEQTHLNTFKLNKVDSRIVTIEYRKKPVTIETQNSNSTLNRLDTKSTLMFKDEGSFMNQRFISPQPSPLNTIATMAKYTTDFAFNFIKDTPQAKLSPRLVTNNGTIASIRHQRQQSKSALKSQKISLIENTVSKQLLYDEEKYIKGILKSKVQDYDTIFHQLEFKEPQPRLTVMQLEATKLAEDLMQAKRRATVWNDWDPNSPQAVETRLPKIDKKKQQLHQEQEPQPIEEGPSGMKPVQTIKVSELPLEVLYSKQLDAVREASILNGVDPRPVTFQYLIELPSHRIKAIKLQPYGEHEEDGGPVQPLIGGAKTEGDKEVTKVNKATFLNGDMPLSPYMIEIQPKLHKKKRWTRSNTVQRQVPQQHQPAIQVLHSPINGQ